MKFRIFAFMLLAIIPAAVFGQDNDFEVVEAGQKQNGSQTKQPTAVKPIQTPTPLTQPLKNTKTPIKKRGVADVQDAQTSITGNLPLRVEVSDLQPNALITLAVGAATRFHSEEKPTRLVIGNLTDIGVTKAGSQGWYGFYLRPVTGGITTNMFIEFASGATVMINLKTVNPKTLRPGDYNSEVFVKTAAVRDELFKLRKDNETLKNQVAKLTAEKNDKPPVTLPTNISDEEMWRFLEQTSVVVKRDGANFWKGGNIEKLKISAVTPFWEVKPGVAYVLIELENKGKLPVILQNVELINGKGELKRSVADLTVNGDKTLRFALKVELKAIEKNPLSLRFTTADGKTFEQLLLGFGNGFNAR